MELTEAECRVLGALIEKHMTTPDHYPLTTNSLLAACNQSSNREPVVTYDEGAVIDAMNGLRTRDLGKTVRRSGERAMKHMEVVDAPLEVDRRQKALLAVLLLRGPQTLGELRSRTERYCSFADLDDVAGALAAMMHRDHPLVVLLDRQPGQKEARYATLLRADRELHVSDTVVEAEVTPGSPGRDVLRELDDLKAEVAELRGIVLGSSPTRPEGN